MGYRGPSKNLFLHQRVDIILSFPLFMFYFFIILFISFAGKERRGCLKLLKDALVCVCE